jgi:error-prone DNA polymerase
VSALVAERRRGGPYRSLSDLAARAGVRSGTLEQLAWSGACAGLAGGPAGRREALWQLGLAAPAQTLADAPAAGERHSTQLALPLALPPAPRLRALGRWQRLIADYSTSGVTTADHAMAILRERIEVPMLATSAQLARLPSGNEVAVAGLVIARQKPGTANGTMFLLFEDEFGTINLIVAREVYERRRHLARAEPLLLAKGRLERHLDRPQEEDGEPVRPVINVLVRELEPLERFLPDEAVDREAAAAVSRLRTGDEAEPAAAGEDGAAEVGSSMRAVAPPVQSFAAGRRR